MNDQQILLINTNNKYLLYEYHARYCFLTKIFYLSENRNSWGHYTSFYPGSRAFHINFLNACNYIEKNRTKGSRWQIHELPGIVFSDYIDAMIIVQINEYNPFHEFLDKIPKSNLFIDIYEAFKNSKQNSVFYFLTKIDFLKPAMFPFLSFSSRSLGGNYELEWDESHGLIKLDSALEIIRKNSQLLQEENFS